MITYQDLKKVTNKEDIIDFVKVAIGKHKASKEYNEAKVADMYNRKRNKTIEEYQKLLYTITGEAVPDNISASYKLKSNFFNYFVTQEVSYLLGNGATWEEDATGEKLGEDFDSVLSDLGENALVHGVSFGFWNYDHLEAFSFLEFVPLWDEEDGSLKAGIRFWQIDKNKPLRATLYTLDGYSDFIWREGEDGEMTNENKPYKELVKKTGIEGEKIYDGENYPTFPIVPLWADKYKQSRFVGLREQIDAIDLIKSGFANDVDDASQIYWILQNAGGMDDVDLKEFIERVRKVGAVNLDDGVKAESHQLNVPYESREVLLTRLRNDLFENAMALDVKNIANGAITATQIRASYEPLSEKADKFEFCVLDFISNILKLANIEDKATFTRSTIVNKAEEVQMVLQAAQFLMPDYCTEKILTILGDGDKADEMIKQMTELSLAMLGADNGQSTQTNGQDNI